MSVLMWITRRLPDWIVAQAMAGYNEKPPMPKEPL
jgi:hypothetical protein